MNMDMIQPNWLKKINIWISTVERPPTISRLWLLREGDRQQALIRNSRRKATPKRSSRAALSLLMFHIEGNGGCPPFDVLAFDF
jgi:hypothetical protein